MKLSSLNSLGTARRGEPCAEYPGTWIVYVNGEEIDTYVDTEENGDARSRAIKSAKMLLDEGEEDVKVSVSWRCSDGDPRVGQVWFTGYYQAYTTSQWRLVGT